VKWKETGFTLSATFRAHDGNVFFVMLLVGISVIVFAAGGFFELLKEYKSGKNDSG
jgi:hypothetical protein